MQLGLNLLDLNVPPEIPNFQKQKEKKIQSPAAQLEVGTHHFWTSSSLSSPSTTTYDSIMGM
jgi:hypothetical protein